jgi:hypothetical protein
MRILLLFVVFLELVSLNAQTLTAEEKSQILKDVQVLKDKVQKLEDIPSPGGLKKVNYENETKNQNKDTPQLSDEEKGNLIRDLDAYKQKQIESQKILDELDKDE